jgi:hypothetical protein
MSQMVYIKSNQIWLISINSLSLPLMTHDKLFGYLYRNKDLPFKVKIVEISEGDQFNYETGFQILFEMFGKKYNVGYATVVEDQEDWAQAESWTSDWCHCDGESIKPQEVWNLVQNYKSEVRDTLINQII